MANPDYNEDKSLVKDEDKVTGLVDSPSTQDDNHEPPLKKQHLTESESNSKSDSDSDTELINHGPPNSSPKMNIMANPGYNEDKSLVKDEDKVTGLVDSPSSQDDNHEPPLKKQHLSQSNSKSDSDTELINHASQDDNHQLPKQHLTESNSKSDSDTELINHASQDDNHELPLKKQHLYESNSVSKSDSDTELINHASQDDNHEPPLKKQHLTESNSKSDSDSDSDTELINHASQDDNHELPLKKQHLAESNSKSDSSVINHGSPYSNPMMTKEYLRKAYLESLKVYPSSCCYNDDDEDEFSSYGNDNNIVKWGPYSGRTADRCNGREVYCIGVNAPIPCNKSISLKLLDMIGCGERFIGCSMEMKSFFFANLNKEEAAKMEGLEGVRKVTPRRFCYSDI